VNYALFVLAAVSTGGVDDRFTASLPVVEGEVMTAAVDHPVSIARDARAVPVISGASLLDAVAGQGFVHAQERLFQMDAARRYAAGELSALIGPFGLAMDRDMRRYRFRTVAREVVDRLPPRHRALLDAYVAGVNDGAAALAEPPPEYIVLGAEPSPWLVEDCVLVMLSMAHSLEINAAVEESLGVMEHALPAALFDFLTPSATRFDAPLIGTRSVGVNDWQTAALPLPGPEAIDLRAEPAGHDKSELDALIIDSNPISGSNNWAVAGTHTAHGGAIVANDPHLMLTAPVIWFRCELAWPDGWAGGVSLPGIPGVIIGSNGAVAWGFTNTTADFQDLIVVEPAAGDSTYQTPDGPRPFGEIVEVIDVRGRRAEQLRLRTTIWGVVNRIDALGRLLVLKWAALDPNLINLDMLDMLNARSLNESIDIGRRWSGPSQNMLAGDVSGRIGWIVTGFLPRREGFSGKTPASWTAPGVGWNGSLDERHRPMLLDPPGGVLYTANNRTVGLEQAVRLANWWDSGVRAARLRELFERQRADHNEALLFAMQHDTETPLFEYYRDLALASLDGATDGEPSDTTRAALRAWNGRADIDSVGLPLLVLFRQALASRAFGPLTRACREVAPGFRYRWEMDEEPLRVLLEERPAHLLDRAYEDWDTLVSAALADAVRRVSERFPRSGMHAAWGEMNISAIGHPLADQAPMLRHVLSMPADAQPGHPFALRVATPTFGASIRMVVSPGLEGVGILNMPCGQSGHPFSPHFRDGHSDWLHATPQPFRATEPVATLHLIPVR
jgi:penicillin amidase